MEAEPEVQIDFEALGGEEGRNGQKPFPRRLIWTLTITQKGKEQRKTTVRNPFPDRPY